MATIPKQVSAYMRKLGKKGGSVSSKAKARAAKLNGKKGGRPKKEVRQFCSNCKGSLTSADREAGECTQCHSKL